MVCFPIKQQFVRLLVFNFYFYDTIRFSTMILKIYCNIKSNEWITLEFVEILRKNPHWKKTGPFKISIRGELRKYS